MIFHLLPLLKGWRYNTKKHSGINSVPIVIQSGKEHRLVELKYPGWIVSTQVAFTGSPDTEIILEYYDPVGGYQSQTFTPNALLQLGYDMPNSSIMYLSSYDTTTNFYNIAFNPSMPFPFFGSENRKLRISIKASEDMATSLAVYSHVVVQVVDKGKFMASLNKVLGRSPEEIKTIIQTINPREVGIIGDVL